MKVELTWKGKLHFSAVSAAGHEVDADARAPLGSDRGMVPKELLLSAMGSCTGMDVAALLHKGRQDPASLVVKVEAELSHGGHPRVFTRVHVQYELTGNIEAEAVLEAVRASQSTFCGVTAMLTKAFPVDYDILLNGTRIGEGKAIFGAGSTGLVA